VRGLFQLCVVAAALGVVPAEAGPNLFPRAELVYDEAVTIGGITWDVYGTVGTGELNNHTQCKAEQSLGGGSYFTIGRDFSFLASGVRMTLDVMSWEAPPVVPHLRILPANLPERYLPTQIDVKFATFHGDTGGTLQGVGILRGWMTKNTILMGTIAAKDLNLIMNRLVTRVEFAVPDRVVPVDVPQAVMIGGFGPQLTVKLQRCFAEIERRQPHATDERKQFIPSPQRFSLQ